MAFDFHCLAPARLLHFLPTRSFPQVLGKEKQEWFEDKFRNGLRHRGLRIRSGNKIINNDKGTKHVSPFFIISNICFPFFRGGSVGPKPDDQTEGPNLTVRQNLKHIKNPPSISTIFIQLFRFSIYSVLQIRSNEPAPINSVIWISFNFVVCVRSL